LLTNEFILREKSLKLLPANHFRLYILQFFNDQFSFNICGMWVTNLLLDFFITSSTEEPKELMADGLISS